MTLSLGASVHMEGVRSQRRYARGRSDGGVKGDMRVKRDMGVQRSSPKEQSKHPVRASACASCNQTSPSPAFGLQHTRGGGSKGGRTWRAQASGRTWRAQGREALALLVNDPGSARRGV